MDPRLAWSLGKLPGSHESQDLRGRVVDSAFSILMPRRLITLAPTLDGALPLETMVAAYCPLPEEGGASTACGDVVVLRGGMGALQQGLDLIQPLVGDDLPCWVWWNSSLDEPPEMLDALAPIPRRLVIDSSLGNPRRCLDVLHERISSGQAINDLNWLRLRSWRQSLAMVFDPPSRRDALHHVVQLDIDVEGDHPVKGLLLAAWIADRLGWHRVTSYAVDGDGLGSGYVAEFERTDGANVRFRLMPIPVGVPKSHPGAIMGLRMICQPRNEAGSVCDSLFGVGGLHASGIRRHGQHGAGGGCGSPAGRKRGKGDGPAAGRWPRFRRSPSGSGGAAGRPAAAHVSCVIAAPCSGSGKTLLSLALAAVARQRGETFQPFKVGPDYLDPQLLGAVAERPCRNLDPLLCGEEWVARCYRWHGRRAERVLVEGVMGLFDGRGPSSEGSTAAVAHQLGLPVVLVVEASRQAGSLAALVRGFRDHGPPSVRLAGVVLNRVGSERHRALLSEALAAIEVPLLGVLPHHPSLALPFPPSGPAAPRGAARSG